MSRNDWVYIMASVWKVLSVGVTNETGRRADQHKRSQFPAFSVRYRVNRLVWFEITVPPATLVTGLRYLGVRWEILRAHGLAAKT